MLGVERPIVIPVLGVLIFWSRKTVCDSVRIGNVESNNSVYDFDVIQIVDVDPKD